MPIAGMVGCCDGQDSMPAPVPTDAAPAPTAKSMPTLGPTQAATPAVTSAHAAMPMRSLEDTEMAIMAQRWVAYSMTNDSRFPWRDAGRREPHAGPMSTAHGTIFATWLRSLSDPVHGPSLFVAHLLGMLGWRVRMHYLEGDV